MSDAILLFALLVAGHYIADFAMQNQFVADMKSKVHTDSHGWHALIAHSVHHAVLTGLAVWIVYSDTPYAIYIGAITGIAHGVIDYAKAVDHIFGINADQVFHLTWLGFVALIALTTGFGL